MIMRFKSLVSWFLVLAVGTLVGTTSGCTFTEFACVDNQQCIPKSYQCDGQPDCTNGSDEIGCCKFIETILIMLSIMVLMDLFCFCICFFLITAQPTIVQLPAAHLISAESSNVTIVCRAVGTPTPIISWLHSWKPVAADSRIRISTLNGLGTLEITQLQPSDGGAYTCQASNIVGHKLASFDTQLIVKCKFTSVIIEIFT